MKASDIPTKVTTVFGSGPNAAPYMRTIPVASQIGITDGAASFTDGFPPLCFQPIGSGGKPPAGPDFQYLFNLITAWNRWQAAGSIPAYDAAFSAAIGGYPAGATVTSTTTGLLWLNTADNNTTNPDSGSGANWISILTGANATTVVNTIVSARPAITTVWVDPTNGSESNDGSSATVPRKSLDAVIGQMKGNATQINLLGDTTLSLRQNVYAPLTIQGMNASNAAAARTINFLGTATNSPDPVVGSSCSGLFCYNTFFRTGNINFGLPSVPAGLNYRSHITSLAGLSASIGNSTVTAGASDAGFLFGTSAAFLSAWLQGVNYNNAQGKMFEGIASGANPNGDTRYRTNITSA